MGWYLGQNHARATPSQTSAFGVLRRLLLVDLVQFGALIFFSYAAQRHEEAAAESNLEESEVMLEMTERDRDRTSALPPTKRLIPIEGKYGRIGLVVCAGITFAAWSLFVISRIWHAV